jgi:NADH dehydrogenase (ubiquinone) 1 beta subcomplex subunit 8
MQMLSLRVARAAQLRSAALAARRLPIIQQRTFLPESINGPEIVDQKYPEYPKLTDEQDPGMVSSLHNSFSDHARARQL